VAVQDSAARFIAGCFVYAALLGASQAVVIFVEFVFEPYGTPYAVLRTLLGAPYNQP